MKNKIIIIKILLDNSELNEKTPEGFDQIGNLSFFLKKIFFIFTYINN